VCVCVCVCSKSEGSHGGTQCDLCCLLCVTCIQRRTETNGPLAVRQRGTGAVADTVFCSAADLVGTSYDEPLKMDLKSV
jgi:hypothetical protein